MKIDRIHQPDRVSRRKFCATLCAMIGSAYFGCRPRPSGLIVQKSILVGQLRQVDINTPTLQHLGPINSVFGAAFLLLEAQYKSLGYAGPPAGYPKTRDEVITWNKQIPPNWWSYESIPIAWWGRESGKMPVEVTLRLDVPVHLLRAHIDKRGRFEFEDLPVGRHTVFMRWGRNPDPQNNLSGPYGVTIGKRGRIEQEFPVSRFDMLDT